MVQNLLFFPIKLFRDEWSLFVVAALPYIGKKSSITLMLCYFDPIGSNGDNADIITMRVKIRQLFNVLWRNKFSSKVDKVENPFRKRSLPLSCFKGKSIVILLVISYLWIFFVNGKFPDTLMFYLFFNLTTNSREANSSQFRFRIMCGTYAAKLSQFPKKILTKSGIDGLIHEMIKNNQDWSLLNQLRKEITSLMLALSENTHLSVLMTPW
jgi:hypothetical protein